MEKIKTTAKRLCVNLLWSSMSVAFTVWLWNVGSGVFERGFEEEKPKECPPIKCDSSGIDDQTVCIDGYCFKMQVTENYIFVHPQTEPFPEMPYMVPRTLDLKAMGDGK